MTKKDLKDAIFTESFEISLSVPIVLVCDGVAQEIKKMLSQKGLPVEPLFELDITASHRQCLDHFIHAKKREIRYLYCQPLARKRSGLPQQL